MRSIAVVFTEKEFEQLKKQKGNTSWHNFILNMSDYYDEDEELNNGNSNNR